ncbi:MAG: CRISPR-associated endonuclease Cas3'' [Desulfobacter sp.]|nr:MAG: CRISPR-associated endonuclease Cas3'' [Desulfobacter sp.]
MSKKLYAHSKDGQPREDWQKLEVHLKNVAQKAYGFSKDFCSSDWAWNAGRLHDLGKAADEFQAYLLRENGLDDRRYDGIGTRKINHSSAGAAFAMEVFGPQVGLVYAYLVSGHHAGLPDFYSSETGRAALPFRLDEGEKNLSNIRQEADKIEKKSGSSENRVPGLRNITGKAITQ